MRKYSITSQFIAENRVVDNGKNLNAIVFTNRGTATVYINGEPIGEDETLSNNGLEGEIDNTEYKIRFDTAGGTLTSNLYVRLKNYE